MSSKKKKVADRKPDEMDRARAAKAYLSDVSDPKQLEMAAFLDIFHPNMSDEAKRRLVRGE